MKNPFCDFCLACFLVIIFIANGLAQEEDSRVHGGLYGGVSIPVGDFAATDGNQTDGYAKTGFSLMLEGRLQLNEAVSWISSISLASNALDNDTYESQSGTKVSADGYYLYWLMSGFSFDIINRSKSKLFGICQIGLLFPSFPDITYSRSNYSSMKQTGEGQASFAYGLGLGIQFEKLSIAFRYYASEPEYHMALYSGDYTYTENSKMPAHLMQIMLGINF